MEKITYEGLDQLSYERDAVRYNILVKTPKDEMLVFDENSFRKVGLFVNIMGAVFNQHKEYYGIVMTHRPITPDELIDIINKSKS